MTYRQQRGNILYAKNIPGCRKLTIITQKSAALSIPTDDFSTVLHLRKCLICDIKTIDDGMWTASWLCEKGSCVSTHVGGGSTVKKSLLYELSFVVNSCLS